MLDRAITFSGFMRFSSDKDELFTIMFGRAKGTLWITAINIHSFRKGSFGLDSDYIGTIGMQSCKIQPSSISKREM
ncbi:hypothetical protein D3C80_1905460 [compost metagenome]